ncbi:MAG: hypothetical protein ACLFUL_12525 [Desulfobacteraceae bacterium]
MKNHEQTDISANVWLFPSEGFTSCEPNYRVQFSPAEQKAVKIPLHMDADVKDQCAYHLIVWYNKDDVHYARHLTGKIPVKDRPVYFKVYVLLGSVLLGVLFFVLFVRIRHTQKCSQSPQESRYRP